MWVPSRQKTRDAGSGENPFSCAGNWGGAWTTKDVEVLVCGGSLDPKQVLLYLKQLLAEIFGGIKAAPWLAAELVDQIASLQRRLLPFLVEYIRFNSLRG